MLEQKDLEAIRIIMKEELKDSENLILGEVDRVHGIMIKNIEQIQKNLDELKQYYRIERLEKENTELLLQMIRGLQKEVDELKQKIA